MNKRSLKNDAKIYKQTADDGGINFQCASSDGTYQMLSLSKDDTGETDKAAGVLLEDVDATDAAKKALVLSRIGIVDGAKIVYPDAATEDKKKSIRNELENIGIITTTGA